MAHEEDHLNQPVLAVARKDVASLREDFTVHRALETIRQRGVGEKIVYFYVVDAECAFGRRAEGRKSLRFREIGLA